MKKLFLPLLLITIANLIILIIALTDKTSMFYNYRWIIGISFLMFGGFLRQAAISRKRVEQ